MTDAVLANVRSILCLGAHSDDIEIGCGGAVLDLVRANPDVDVHWCVFSGTEPRDQEARVSAERFLARVHNYSIETFPFRDSFFPDQWKEIKETLADLSKRVQPDVIFTHHLDDRHQDHRCLAELTWCGFRDHLVLEYEIPKYEGDLGKPNVYWPLETDICERKIQIILESFRSQSSKAWFDEELFRSLMRLRGSECYGGARYAEAFHCRKATVRV